MREPLQHPKWAVSLTALAVLGLAASGCSDGRSNARRSSEPAAKKQRVQSIAPPKIERLQVAMLWEPEPNGNARLLATVSSDSL